MSSQQILGIHFFDGMVAEAVAQALDRGGLIVAPSGTCFARLSNDAGYRSALMEADLVLPDSGFMVLLWRMLRGRRIPRISGFAYLKELLRRPELRQNGAVLWILPDEDAREKTMRWLQDHGFSTTRDDCYVAPIYGLRVEDPSLLERIESARPRHMIIALSGGVQEKLGFYLREKDEHRSAIHCIGAALGFITGYQIAIPAWADRLYLGWFLRLISNPRKFLPRALSAAALPQLIIRYGEKLPPLRLRKEPGERQEFDSLHVLMLLTDGFGSSGGMAKFNRDFLTALCSHVRVEGVTAIPRLMPNDPGTVPAKLRTELRGLGGKGRFSAAVTRTALNLRRELSPAASPMIFCGHINLLPVALLAKRITGGTLHLIIHGIEAWHPANDLLVRGSLRRIDGFIAVSKVTKKRFESWTGLRFDEGIVLPNCVDLGALHPGPKPPLLLDRYGLAGRKVIMTLARLAAEERYKGIDEVMELLPALAERYPGIAYLICGDGNDRSRLVEKARKQGFAVSDFTTPENATGAVPSVHDSVRPRVVFTGKISDAEKADHYRVADVYVMPGSGEGFGIVYLEALACGIPVIGSKIDGSRDALRDGALGILVDPDHPDEIREAILSLLDDAAPFKRGTRPEGLDFFSTGRFAERVHEIVDRIAPAALSDQCVERAMQ